MESNLPDPTAEERLLEILDQIRALVAPLDFSHRRRVLYAAYNLYGEATPRSMLPPFGSPEPG